MNRSDAEIIDGNPRFSKRREDVTSDIVDFESSAPIFHIPRAVESGFDYPSSSDVKRIYTAAASEIVKLLYENHYTIFAFHLKQRCLEAILDGLDEISVRQIAEEGLRDADPLLYQYALRRPDLSDATGTV